MRLIIFGFIGVIALASCAKEEVITFDDRIGFAEDYKVDANE